MSSSYSMRATSCTADHLLSASGVHHLIANHQQILSETVYRSFEVPLLHDLDKWKTDIEDAEAVYQKEVAARSKEIRRLEKEGLKLHKQRRRDLGKFREHLVQLTGKLDGLSELHGNHAQGMLRDSQEASMKILEASCSLVRAEVDIFESLARKGWSGGGLDDLLEKGRDLFAADEEGPGTATAGSEQAKLFSILPPKSILADTASDSGGRGRQGAHKRSDSLLGEGDRYQSLAGAVTITGDVDGDADADSIFSEVNHRSGVRPFSPQPIRRVPTDVVMDPENLLEGVEEPTHQQTDSETEKGDGDEDEDEDDGTGTLRPRRPRHGESRPRVDERQPNPGADDADSDTEDRESPWKDEGLRQASSSTENP
ncbi:hypothetical protein F5Y18DRAFT_401320 [Xylariaceae sp. FL1019]|nr:hypothetical protein F5Y18DRAFT_401320 [Xylariaceae sp. FL1019]